MNSTCELGRHSARALKPYPDYKDSGVPWLGEVPAHWEVAPVKQKYAIRLGKMLQPARRASDDCRISYLKAKHVQWFEVRTNDIDTMWATPDEVGRYGIVAGDLLVCEGGEGGRCGIVKHGTALPDPCIIQNALHRVRPRSWGSVGDISRNDYLQYMMSTVASTGWFDVLTDKATIAHFTAKKFGALLASIPPLPEQAAIVRFLDHADRRIRRYIRAKQQLIALLEEQKQALIHQAVTRGLDPNVRLKPSGVERLGNVPEHWKILPLKRSAWFKSGAGFPVAEQGQQDSEIPFIKVSDMTRPGNEVWIELTGSSVSSATATRLGAFVFPAGSIIFPKVGGALLTNKRRLLRRPSCIDNNVMGCVVSEADLDYAFILLQQLDLGRLAKPGPVPAIGEGEVRAIKVVLPPTQEQVDLVTIIHRETANLDSVILTTKRETTLLREYRARLIADVVTGKLDVRAAAARLPDEAEEPELLDETDALTDVEDEPSDDLGAVAAGAEV